MRSSMTLSFFLVLSAGLAAADEKKADDNKYESKEGRFAAVFPAKPMETTQKQAEGDLHITIVEVKGTGYAVIHSDFDAAKVKLLKPQDVLAGGEKGLVDTTKAVVTSSKETTFGKAKLPARQITGEMNLPGGGAKVNLRLLLVLADNRLYQVLVMGPKEATTGADADKFFDSFEITK